MEEYTCEKCLCRDCNYNGCGCEHCSSCSSYEHGVEKCMWYRETL